MLGAHKPVDTYAESRRRRRLPAPVTGGVRREMMKSLQRFIAGFLTAAFVLLTGLGSLSLYAHIFRPEDPPFETARGTRIAALVTLGAIAGAFTCGKWYLKLLRTIAARPTQS